MSNILLDSNDPNPLFTAADVHNISNGNPPLQVEDDRSFLEKTEDTIANIGKFTVAAGVSAVEGFYNTGVLVANTLGANAGEMSTEDVLARMDSNLADYYVENKSAIDMAGFAIGSLVPGTAGVKILNAGSKVLRGVEATGKIGKLMSATTGLLDESVKSVRLAEAAKTMSQSETILSAVNANSVKAIGTAFAKNALESAVFETSAVLGLAGSNYVKDSTLGDLATNAVTGMLVGGAVGGTLESVGILGKVKKLSGEIKASFNEERFRTPVAPALGPSDALVVRLEDLAKHRANPEASAITGHTIESLQADVGKYVKQLADPQYSRAVQDFALLADEGEAASRLLKANKIGGTPKEGDTLINLFGEDAGKIVKMDNLAKPFAQRLGDLFPNVEEAKLAVLKYSQGIKPLESIVALDATQRELRFAAFRDLVKELPENFVVNSHDIPALDWLQLNRNVGGAEAKILVGGEEFAVKNFSEEQFTKFVQDAKLRVANDAVANGKSIQEAAAYANIKASVLRGELGEVGDDFLATQGTFNKYREMMNARNLPMDKDVLYRPTTAKISYEEISDEVTSAAQAFAVAASNNKIAFEAMQSELKQILGDDVISTLPRLDAQEILRDVHRQQVGATFLGQASNTEGLAAKMEYIGKQVANLTEKRMEDFNYSVTSAAVALRNNPTAAREWEALMQEVNRTTTKYSVVPFKGKTYLLNANTDLLKYDMQDIVNSGGRLIESQYGAKSLIPIENKETSAMLSLHMAAQQEELESRIAIARARGENTAGLEANIGTVYGIKPDPKKFPYVAFVRDNNLIEGAAGQMTMLHAATEKELEGLMQSARGLGGRYSVFDRKSGEIFHQLAQDYDRSLTLWRTSIDSELASKGINSKFFQATDPNAIVDDFLNFHRAAIANRTRAEVASYYEEAFSTIKGLGEEYARTSGSKYGTAFENWLDSKDKNPAFDFIKTALNISRRGEYPIWNGFNTLLSRSFDKAWDGLKGILGESPTPANLEQVSAELEKYGAKTAYADAALEVFRNHTAGQGNLTKFISTVNGALGFLTLRMNPMNALNNALGANVLLSTEATAQIAKLRNLDMPGIGKTLSVPKMIADAQADFFSKEVPELERYVSLGIVPKRGMSVIEKMLNDAAISGGESAAELASRSSRIASSVKELMQGAEKWSGNMMAEMNTRYVTARVAEKIGRASGYTGTNLDVFVNGMVNRVNGNLLASQRPTLFQGPLGQAIGLFQSYQFNMLQNIFRNVSEGNAKSLAVMLGMQSTLYGAKSLPGFNYINENLVGNAAGNQQHKDLFDASYGVLGKQGAETLMYGIPSNLLGVGIFTSGDANPRNATIIPSKLSEIPAIGSTLQMFSNALDTAKRIEGGAGIVNSLLMGIEHNGISKPLSGVAQLARAFTSDSGQAFSTTTKGTLIGASDLVSFSSLIRAAGGRPFDEAVSQDKMFRISSYVAADKAKMLKAAETAKIAFGGKQGMDADTMEAVLKTYAEAGGRQATFNQWAMKQMLAANTPAVTQMIGKLKSHDGVKYQQLLGGSLPEGFDYGD